MLLPNGIYDAEGAINDGPEMILPAEIQGFVDLVTGSDYWKEISRIVKVAIVLAEKPETGAWKANARRGEIQVWQPISHLIVLHELAHLLAWVEPPTHAPDHGREFIRQYVGLVERFLGRRTAERLREEIIARKVYGFRVCC